MFPLIRNVTACLILLLLLPVMGGTITYAVEDAIIAIVNDDVITHRDLEEYMNSVYMQLKLEGKSPQEIRQIILELNQDGLQRLIEEKLILGFAKEKNVQVREAVIDERVMQIKRNYPSERVFLDALLTDGATVTDLRNKITEQLKVQFVIEEEVKSKIYVTPQDVTEYYKNNFEDFQKPERVKLKSIFIAKSRDYDDTRKRAEKALSDIVAGTDFSEVAAQYSQAPPIGTIKMDGLMPEIQQAISGLAVGETSDIVETDRGYFLVKLEENLPSEVSSLDEVKEVISKKLFQQKLKQRFQDWIAKLKHAAFIELK